MDTEFAGTDGEGDKCRPKSPSEQAMDQSIGQMGHNFGWVTWVQYDHDPLACYIQLIGTLYAMQRQYSTLTGVTTDRRVFGS